MLLWNELLCAESDCEFVINIKFFSRLVINHVGFQCVFNRKARIVIIDLRSTLSAPNTALS